MECKHSGAHGCRRRKEPEAASSVRRLCTGRWVSRAMDHLQGREQGMLLVGGLWGPPGGASHWSVARAIGQVSR